MENQRYILDCDPGHDDAVALLFAAKFLSLVGITTVFGNSTVDNTTRLTIPVARGLSAPLTGEIHSGESVHGKTGLDGANLPAPSVTPITSNAPEFIIDSARKLDNLSIIAIGPLTNIAAAINEAPDVTDRICEISIMGGSTTFGNATPSAEFNIYADPEAARIVFASGIPVRMAGLNVTTTFGITRSQVKTLQDADSRLAKEIGGALNYYLQRQTKTYHREFAPIHDVCAVIPHTHSDLIRYTDMHVDIECSGTLTRGQTVCDQRLFAGEGLTTPQPVNTAVAIDADGKAIVRHVMTSLLSYP
jgi:inosine-uridine nucleoside N-ribohydrolase